jgi:dihydrofolate reductase
MIISILASTSAGGIGNQGTLPWPKNSEDLKWFKEHTTGHIVVMGRKTWDDPMMPKPLPNRINCVVSNRIVDNINVRRLRGDIKQEVLTLQAQFPEKNVFIIGGKSVYEATQNIVDRVYLTRMKQNYWADTRVNLDLMLMNFRIQTVRPGHECTYEIWNRIS